MQLAQILEVSPHALDVPDIDSNIGLMHTLFTPGRYPWSEIGEIDGELCLRLDKKHWDGLCGTLRHALSMVSPGAKSPIGEITKDQYDQWRYTYPKMEVERTRRERAALHEKRKAENDTDLKKPI